MRYLSYLTTLLIAVLLTACGGGGGSAGTSSGSVPTPAISPPSLFTTAPASLTVSVGAAQEFTIGGGTSPYTAVSNNASIAIAGVKDTRLTLGGVADGTAQITIRDAAGATVTVGMIVSSGPVRPLYTTATSSITVAPGLSGAQTYSVGGGAGPYIATSSNVSVASVVLTGDSMKVTGISAGSTNLVIMDSLGAMVTVNVTVPTVSNLALFTTAPASVTVAIGASPAYSVGGGTGPYTATSSNTSVATVSLVGSNLTVNGLAAGIASVVLRDSAGASTTVAVTVVSTAGVLAVTPDTASAYVDTVVEVAITGGVPPYRVAGGILSAAQTSINGSTLTITPLLVSSGLDISILDSQNQTAKFTLTVIAGQPTIRLSPNALTVSENQAQAIALTAFGATGAVNAFSSDLTLFTTAVNGNVITVNQIARCVATDTAVTITVVDASRAFATSVITVKDNGNTPAVVGPPAVVASNCPP